MTTPHSYKAGRRNRRPTFKNIVKNSGGRKAAAGLLAWGRASSTSRQRGSAALSLRASARREASALGVHTGAAIRFFFFEGTDSHADDVVAGSE